MVLNEVTEGKLRYLKVGTEVLIDLMEKCNTLGTK